MVYLIIYIVNFTTRLKYFGSEGNLNFIGLSEVYELNVRTVESMHFENLSIYIIFY